LESIGYLPDVDAAKAAEDSDLFLKEVFSALEKRALAYDYFFDNEPWDLFIGVITETDRLHHFFFDAARDQGHKYHNLFISFYKRIDEIIGRLFTRFMEKTGGRGLFMTMSDHGFTVLRQEVYVNSLLRERGFLKINKQREYFEQIDTGTKAFCMDPARIYVNLEGRFPGGPVSLSGKKDVIKELKNLFASLEDSDGNVVIKSIYDNGEIYQGPSSDKGPDLVCLANDGYDLKGSLKKEHVFGKGQFTGMHTRYDAHCILPGNIEMGSRLHIENLAGIILNYFSKERTWNT
ncbi:MAG: alkaline phosphatase family protein, partial [Nitrospirota bacterium]